MIRRRPPKRWSPAALRRLAWMITAAYALGLFIVTHLPPARLPRVRVGDKLQHFISYAILAALLMLSLQMVRTVRRPAIWVLLAIAVFGAIDELTQPLVGRTASLWDWLADVAGGATAVAIILILNGLHPAPRDG